MNKAKRPKSLFIVILRDGALTLITEGFVLISFFIFYRLLADYYGPEEVGVYSLMRRVVAILIPVVLLGLFEGLGRYIALVRDETERYSYIICGVWLFLISMSSVMLVLNLNAVASAKWALGDTRYATFVFPFSVLLAGLSFHTFSYACLRGSLHIKLLNVLQFLNLGILPLFVLTLGKQYSFQIVVTSVGTLHLAVAIAFLWPTLMRAYKINIMHNSFATMKELIMYSVPRIPAPIASAGLISLGPIVASHYVSMTEVGYLSLAITLLIGIGGAISPLGTVLLPHISSLLGSGQIDRFGTNLYLLIGAVFQSLLFLLGQFIVFVEYILIMWLGEAFLPASVIMVVIFTSLIAYGFYNIARNILDASSVRPINTINSLISVGLLALALVVVTYWVPSKSLTVMFALAFTIAFNLLGALSYYAVRKIHPFKVSEDWRHFKWGIFLSCICAVFAFAVKSYVTVHWITWIAFELLLFLLYIISLWLLKFEWINVIYKKASTIFATT